MATDTPSRGKRTKKMTKWRLTIQYIRCLFAKQTPTLLSWPICLSIDFMLIITPLGKNKHYNSIMTNTDTPDCLWERVGTKPPARLQLLREDSCVIKVSAIYIFEKQTTKLLSWRIYILVDFMVSTPLLAGTTGRPKHI